MKYSEEDLLKYFDGELSEERSLQLREAARHDAILAENLSAMEASQLPYKAAFDQRKTPDMPEGLRASVDHWVALTGSVSPSPVRQQRRVWTVLASAACVVASVGLGYTLAWQQHRPQTDNREGIVSASADSPQSMQSAWVERVADYQSLYVENTVKGTENGTERAEELLERISNLSGLSAGIPDLSSEGYRFVRAQELGYMDEPLVQLVYTKPGTAPLALCYMPAENEADQPLLLAAHHGLGTASWIAGGQRFVLVADEAEPVLRQLYKDAQTSWL